MTCRLCGADSGGYPMCSECDPHRQDDNEVEEYEMREEAHE